MASNNQRKYLRIVRRAIREDWPVGPHKREVLTEELFAIVMEGADPRSRIMAGRVLVEMEGQNLSRARLALDALKADEDLQLDDLRERLDALDRL